MSVLREYLNFTTKAVAVMAVTLTPCFADILFFDDFESPDVEPTYKVEETSRQIDESKWVRADEGYGHQQSGIVDEGENGGSNFDDPRGSQAFATRYTNSGATTVEGAIGVLTKGVTYTVSFDVVVDGYNSGADYNIGLVTFSTGARRSDATPNEQTKSAHGSGSSAILAFKEGKASGSKYEAVSFSYTADGSEKTLGQDLAVRILGATHSANIDNMKVVATGGNQPISNVQPRGGVQLENTYIHWIAQYPSVGDNDGFDDDADGDGIVNGLENFFGTAPDQPSSGLVNASSAAGNSNTFTFKHPENPKPASNISWPIYAWSSDNKTFHISGKTVGGTTFTFERSKNTPSPGMTTVTAKIKGVVPEEIYVKVAVTLNP